jgi:hypothetical protein
MAPPNAYHAISDRMYQDHEIYCIRPWCVRSGQLTPAEYFLGTRGQPEMPSCRVCTRTWQAITHGQAQIWPADQPRENKLVGGNRRGPARRAATYASH